MALILATWDHDAPCHTHGCYGRIRWKIVPSELVEVTAAVVAGLCDDCKGSLLSFAEGAQAPAPIGWPEVDKFLRAHRDDEFAIQIIEGATGMFLREPTPAQQGLRCTCGAEFSGKTAKAKLASHQRSCKQAI